MTDPRIHHTTRLAADVINYQSQLANEELFERIMERIHRYFLKVLRSEQEAEDCLQETLVILEESLRHNKYDPTRSFNTWLWIKARTIYAQWCRKRSKQMGSLPAQVPERKRSDSAMSARMDAEEVLDEVARQLGHETYEAFVLFYEGGLTKGEVAEVLGRDPKTIRKRIREAHALIEKLVE